MTAHKQEKKLPSETTFKDSKVNKQISQATKAVSTKVDTNYTQQNYEPQNAKVSASTNKNINTATSNAESAYRLAAKNTESNASKANAANAMATRQINSKLNRSGASQSARNVASVASARSASSIATARSNAIKNAEATKHKTISQAKVNAYNTQAKLQAENTNRDIARSTALNKEKAQQKAQSTEAQKSRNLKNAITRKSDKVRVHEQKLREQEKRHEKKMRNLATYSKTLPNRYSSVKSVDKAIKKMKKKKGSLASQKLAYLQSLRAALLKQDQEKKQQARSGGSGRGGSRGGRRSYGRRYGSGNGGANGNDYSLDGGNGSGSTKKQRKKAVNSAVNTALAAMYTFAGDRIKAENKKKQSFKKAKTRTTGKGTSKGKKTPSYISAILKHVKK